MTDWSLAFVAHAVHRRGGQERAAAEVLARIARRVSVTVLARVCEVEGVVWMPVTGPSRPSVLRTWVFARAARAMEVRAGCTITNAIGAAALDADVITAQFCHAAFTERYGGIRGGSAPGKAYQRFAQAQFVREERRAYGSPRLRRVIAVSTGTARELREHYGVRADCIRVVPNGVDHAVFRPAPDAAARRTLRARLGVPPDVLLALFMGGDWERKGVGDAVNAVAGVADVHLAIVGRGDSVAMRAHAARAGATARVHIAPPSAAPQEWYAAADLFLFPSRYEAFSLVTLEAAASGLPIICHRINGTEELVTDGSNGWLVPFGPDALRERVVALRDDAALRRRMSAAAVESSRRYAWDRVAGEYFDVLAEAVADPPVSRSPSPAGVTSAAANPTPPAGTHATPPVPPGAGGRRRISTLQIGLEWFDERPGGLNRVYAELVRHLPAAGVEVHGLVAGTRDVASQTAGTVAGFAPHSAPLAVRLAALWRRGRAALREDPSRLVVSHFALHASPLLRALGNRPLVVHFQGPWGLEGGVEHEGAFVVRAKTAVERAVYTRASALIVLSKPFGTILQERFGVPASRIHVVPGGVDADRFNVAETRAECRDLLGWPQDRRIVLSVRRLVRRMGLDDLVMAAAALRERVPDVLVLIAGRGAIAGELEHEIARHQLGEHVRLLGFVPDDRLPYAYRAADVSVVPSIALEGFGLTVAESLAAGTPVLVTPVGGLPEVVGALSPHLTLSGTGPAALTDGIANALMGRAIMPSATECQQFAREHYDWPVVAERVAQVYEAALG